MEITYVDLLAGPQLGTYQLNEQIIEESVSLTIHKLFTCNFYIQQFMTHFTTRGDIFITYIILDY